METFDDVLRRWGDAEARGDVAALEVLLDADFRGDGPLGFVLGKQQWLDRHRRGELITHAFTWRITDARVTGHTAIGNGIQSQVAECRGADCSGDYRCTVVAIRRDDRWTIVNVQLGRA
jgi:Domain of unknown function (DUF4440)